MYKTFTQNDLIRSLYSEMTSEESILLQEALLNDSDLCDTYYELKSSMDLLDSESESLVLGSPPNKLFSEIDESKLSI